MDCSERLRAKKVFLELEKGGGGHQGLEKRGGGGGGDQDLEKGGIRIWRRGGGIRSWRWEGGDALAVAKTMMMN